MHDERADHLNIEWTQPKHPLGGDTYERKRLYHALDIGSDASQVAGELLQPSGSAIAKLGLTAANAFQQRRVVAPIQLLRRARVHQ
jgi:hypothetical protein